MQATNAVVFKIDLADWIGDAFQLAVWPPIEVGGLSGRIGVEVDRFAHTKRRHPGGVRGTSLKSKRIVAA